MAIKEQAREEGACVLLGETDPCWTASTMQSPSGVGFEDDNAT